MPTRSAGGGGNRSKVRYAVVGLGHIAQVAVLPAFAHATENSLLAALVSSDPVKLLRLGRKYRVPHRYSYADFGACLRSGKVDAVYLALPNHLHREYAVRAAEAGVHNAARHLFADEPDEVFATTTRGALPKFALAEESASVVLRFPGERTATFVVSFGAADVSSYQVVGTRGDVRLDPAYAYAEPIVRTVTVDDRRRTRRFARHDQFAPELVHFSESILRGAEPGPSGREGLADVRIIRALYRSAATGRPVALPPFPMAARPTGAQAMRKPAVKQPRLIDAEPSS